MRKVICAFLAIIWCLLGGLNNYQFTASAEANYETAVNYSTNGLHKVNIGTTGKDFVVKGKTDYQFVTSDDGPCGEACAFINKHIATATGVALPISIEENVAWTSESKYIVMGRVDLFEQAGLSMPKEDLGVTGYYIKSVGNSVFIMTSDIYGWQHAGIAFLSAVLGYDMICEDTVVYEKDGSILPTMEIIEKPDFDFKYEDNIITTTEVYGMGFLRQAQIFIAVNGRFVHNSTQYLPFAKYQSAHPGWYSTTGDQLCYTARGDIEERKLMIDTVVNVIKEKVDTYKTINNITLTIDDVGNFCTCDACRAEASKYGTDSAVIVKFCNEVAKKVDEYLEKQAQEQQTQKRSFNIVFFAYKTTEAAPVKMVNGQYQPVDESVVCRDNVGVYIAPIGAKYEYTFYDDINSNVQTTIKGWAACCNKLFFWLYDTNYRNYLYPYNSFDSYFETLRFCKTSNAYMIVTEGQYNTTGSTAFNRFKIYLHAKGTFNVNINYTDVVNKYFKYYFADAAEPMKKYFTQLQAHMKYLNNQNPETLTGGIYDNIAESAFWPKRLLQGWMDLIEEAYAAIEMYKDTDPELYTKLYDHICIESVFPRYALVSLHSGLFSSETVYKMKDSLMEDMTKYKIVRYSEGGLTTTLYRNWGLA